MKRHHGTESWAAGTSAKADRSTVHATADSVAAIFIHAGAGYHSVSNEKIHLEACNEAARIAMRFLKNGATATEAVEIAIKCLEDKEITNAGYGSNLNMDGAVEGDATMVDHMGRSGACGAVPNIKNPISLAKLILDTSQRPLSLRRVPPNLLVGSGARDFAISHGIEAVDNSFLVSKNARDRFTRWKEDLRKAEMAPAPSPSPSTVSSHSPNPDAGGPSQDYGQPASPKAAAHRRDHTNAILMATWNEGQPDSPGAVPGSSPSSARSTATTTPRGTSPGNRSSPLHFLNTLHYPKPGSSNRRTLAQSRQSDEAGRSSPSPTPGMSGNQSMSTHDGPMGSNVGLGLILEGSSDVTMADTRAGGRVAGEKRPREAEDASELDMSDIDMISDTVGAIAIDIRGFIAGGSSSGGIGMKHKGRIGPAALVGIGTAVIPEDPQDENQISVAAVTSGTGEHMATTLASYKCADRLYHNTRRGPGGSDLDEFDEDALMESCILDDFMGHPGVRNQCSQGAIGVMAVKKSRNGYYFFFAHNTDSFALASMASTDREPLTVMSRIGEVSDVARGARKIRIT